jgi:hypothetical protein
MPWVEFEPAIPVSERARTFHALHLTATVIDTLCWEKEEREAGESGSSIQITYKTWQCHVKRGNNIDYLNATVIKKTV